MDTQQTQQWNDFACMSEALIKAASIKKVPLTADEYRTKYEKFFPCPRKHYGGLILSRFYRIANDVGLGNDMDLIWHYKDIKERFDSGKLVFVFSGLHLHQGRCDPFSHTSVLLSIDENTFSVDGCPNIPKDDWVNKRCCGIVFY